MSDAYALHAAAQNQAFDVAAATTPAASRAALAPVRRMQKM